MSMRVLARGAVALTVAGTMAAVVAACTDKSADVLGPQPSQGDGMFQSYVALGNSITAGYQSGGINDSTQKRSYAVLLAGQMGTRFAYPAVAMPGCPPPISNFLTQARVTPTGFPPSTSTSCYLRTTASSTDILNNVAVPGATSFDPNAATTSSSNLLTTLVLGGKTQVQRALDATPTFASVWLGNNDVLAPALSGVIGGATPLTTFQTNYDKTIGDLVAGAPGLQGVLIGVVNVTNAPALFPVSLLINSAAFRGAFDQAAGFNPASSDPFKKTPLTIDASCTTQQTTLVSFLIAPAIASFRNDSTKADPTQRAGHPPVIQCGSTGTAVGEAYILLPAEITALTTLVNGYNTYISGKAQAEGFAYVNPNQALDSLKALGEIAPGPNFASPNLATAPFGKWVSLDGVHPSSAAHALLANYVINAINAKYGTTLAKVAVP